MRAMHSGATVPVRVREYFAGFDIECEPSKHSVDLEGSGALLTSIASLFEIDEADEQVWSYEEWMAIKRVIAHNLRMVAEVYDSGYKKTMEETWRF